MEPSSSGRPTRSLPEQRSSAEFPPNERVRCPCRDDGGGEIVRFFARLDLGTAFATLIRQRHPMPSCGGLAPTAERTVDPARTLEESLTSDPGIRERSRRARLRRADHRWKCPFIGVKRSCRSHPRNDAFDPEQTTVLSLKISRKRDAVGGPPW